MNVKVLSREDDLHDKVTLVTWVHAKSPGT